MKTYAQWWAALSPTYRATLAKAGIGARRLAYNRYLHATGSGVINPDPYPGAGSTIMMVQPPGYGLPDPYSNPANGSGTTAPATPQPSNALVPSSGTTSPLAPVTGFFSSLPPIVWLGLLGVGGYFAYKMFAKGAT